MDNAVVTEWLTQPGGLASRLRMLRANASLKGQDLAATLGWGPTKVSKIENGRQLPSPDEVRRWVKACGADTAVADELVDLLEEAKAIHLGWRDRMRSGQAAVQSTYNQLAEDAQTTRLFETVFVPGLLQIPEYASRVLTEMVELHELDVKDIDDAVAKRMSRHQHLYDNSKSFEFIVAEPVLRWRLCSTETMLAQLDRLRTAIDLPNVRFGIIPFATQLDITPQNSFGIYDDLVIVDTFAGELIYENSTETRRYAKIADRLWDYAVEGAEARALIDAAAAELRSSA